MAHMTMKLELDTASLAQKIYAMADWLDANPDRSHEVLGRGTALEIDSEKHIKMDIVKDGNNRKIVCTPTGVLAEALNRFEALQK